MGGRERVGGRGEGGGSMGPVSGRTPQGGRRRRHDRHNEGGTLAAHRANQTSP